MFPKSTRTQQACLFWANDCLSSLPATEWSDNIHMYPFDLQMLSWKIKSKTLRSGFPLEFTQSVLCKGKCVHLGNWVLFCILDASLSFWLNDKWVPAALSDNLHWSHYPTPEDTGTCPTSPCPVFTLTTPIMSMSGLIFVSDALRL